jgi:hypothetical protein
LGEIDRATFVTTFVRRFVTVHADPLISSLERIKLFSNNSAALRPPVTTGMQGRFETLS